MTRLSLQVSLETDETIMSFASRLAAKNGPSFVQDFCLDMGLHWLKLIHSNQSFVTQLAELVDKCPNELARRALVKIDGRRCLLNDQLLGARSYIREDQKVCPKCLMQDEDQHGVFGPFGRKEWLLSSFRVCPKHLCHMIALPKVSFPLNQYDFYRRYAMSRQKIVDAANQSTTEYASDWEVYLQRRLKGDTGERWIDKFELDAAMCIVQNLGITLAFGPAARNRQLSFAQLSEANIAGYHAVCVDENRLVEAMTTIRLNSKSKVPGFHVDFGMFARWCTRISGDQRYNYFIDMMAGFAFENYPMDKGELLFGRLCPKRSWYNCLSAAKAYGTSHSHD